jgi:DNA polymerase/3'-5' exonuclease PolX
LVEFSKTSSLRILEEEAAVIQTKKAMDVFAGIYGVGEKKAEELVNAGITTLEQLQVKQDEVLNDKQRVGLKYYNDIAQRIPRSEIQQYEAIFRTATDTQMEIVGSYRRGAADSGDIDVILTSDDPTVFVKFVDALVATGIIVEVLSRGKSKCLVITKLPDARYARRVDFLFATPAEYPFAVLYFTGSKEFNVVMRENALNMGYSLNEHGLSHMENRKKGALVEHVFADESYRCRA